MKYERKPIPNLPKEFIERELKRLNNADERRKLRDRLSNCPDTYWEQVVDNYRQALLLSK